MPKLLVFAPCEKVIISQDENNPTLIAILSTIGGSLEVTEPPESRALGQMRWSIFTLWQQESGDHKKTFVQRLRIISPSGRMAIDGPQDFKLTATTHRMTAQFGQVPVGEPGNWEIQLFLYEKDAPIPDKPLATYPLEIRFAYTVKAAVVQKQ